MIAGVRLIKHATNPIWPICVCVGL